MAGLSGQGKVLIAKRNPDGSAGAYRWLGNTPKFEIGLEEEVTEKSESYSGSRLPFRRVTKSRKGTLSVTMDEASKANMALVLNSLATLVAAPAAVADRPLAAAAAVGDILSLFGAKAVSNVVIKDSSGAPKVLVAGVNYSVSPFAGTVEILDLANGGPFVMPLTASLTPGATTQVGAFTTASAEYSIMLDGMNSDDGSRFIVDVYRVRLSPAKALSLITEDYAEFELEGTVLADMTRTAEGVGGQFFNITLPALAT
jgi:hypothetical protein